MDKDTDQGRSWLKFLLYTAVAIVIWKFPSKTLQDVIVGLAFIYSLCKAKRGLPAWKNAAGYSFAVVLIYAVITVFTSVTVDNSIRDFMKQLDDICGMFAVTVLFWDRKRLETAILSSATAFTLILTYHLVQMAVDLKGDLMTGAHAYEPFILNHSNVASMAAGAAFMCMVYFAWKYRKERLPLVLCCLGIVLNLAYKVVISSRGPQAAFAVAVGLSGIFIFRNMRHKVVWIIVMAIGGTILLANLKHVSPRFLDKSTMSNFTERDKVWIHSAKLTKDHPIIGHGFGKRTFQSVYHSSNPPESPFQYHHTHQYWLFILFCHGWIGVVLIAAAWLLLAVRLIRKIYQSPDLNEERLLPVLILLLLAFVHAYGMGDFPDHVVRIMQLWLVPAALIVTKNSASTAQAETKAAPAISE